MDDYWDGSEGMLDLCAGLALLTQGEVWPEGWRAFLFVMGRRDAARAERATAVAIKKLRVRGTVDHWIVERWEKLRSIRVRELL